MKLAPTDMIVTAYATNESGAGWANWPLWVIVRDKYGTLREECLQPLEHPRDALTLFAISVEVHKAMVAALEPKRRTKA